MDLNRRKTALEMIANQRPVTAARARLDGTIGAEGAGCFLRGSL